MALTKRLKKADDNRLQHMCPEYEVMGEGNIDQYLRIRDRLAADHPKHYILLSLDDPYQADYTSGHAIEKHGLQNFDEKFRDRLPPRLFEEKDYIGWGETIEEFPLRLHNFRNHAADASFEHAVERGIILLGEELDYWLEFQTSPEAAFEPPVSAMCVPVENSSEALAVLPNGYFTCDLSPGESFAVLSKLAEFEYQLFGIGASFYGLLRSEPADSEIAASIAKLMCRLYNVDAGNTAHMRKLFADAIEGQKHLFVRYTD